MSTEAPDRERTPPHRSRQPLLMAGAAAATVPGVVLRFTEPHIPHPVEALVYGVAIVGAAFVLSWAAEAAQLDISAGLAIAVLALITVLPEYAVDFVFAHRAGNAVEQFGEMCKAPGAEGATSCSLALANMTGANRLLIGIGWSMVVFLAWWRARQQGESLKELVLSRTKSVELALLAVASIYCLSLPFKPRVMLLDTVVLVGIFAFYMFRVSKAPPEEPHLVGPARYVGSLSKRGRRTAVVTMMIFAAAIILLCAEHFAEALVQTGKDVGISEFFLVQWLAPLASEAPELLVAALYAWRLNTNASLGTLVSAKVNQWTLLVGTLPVVFGLSSGDFSFFGGLPIDSTQQDELFLTAAQSIFAVAILASFSITTREAQMLFGLFWAQFVLAAVVPSSAHGLELTLVAIAYLVLGAALLVRDRKQARTMLGDGLFTPYERLQSAS